MPFDLQSLAEILVCPESHQRLVHDGQRLVSVDPIRRLSYPIVDDIPIMLIDEATELPQDEWQAVMERAGRHPGTGEATGNEKAEPDQTNSSET